jgi:hypothetical protein
MVELIVVLAIIALLAGVVAASISESELAPRAGTIAAARARVAEARREAITSRGPVVVVVRAEESGVRPASDTAMPVVEWRATALPDGRVIADPALGIEHLTGRPVDAGGAR